jgi:hypothetical protein
MFTTNASPCAEPEHEPRHCSQRHDVALDTDAIVRQLAVFDRFPGDYLFGGKVTASADRLGDDPRPVVAR